TAASPRQAPKSRKADPARTTDAFTNCILLSGLHDLWKTREQFRCRGMYSIDQLRGEATDESRVPIGNTSATTVCLRAARCSAARRSRSVIMKYGMGKN